VSKLPALLGVLVLATLPLALGCSSTNCAPIPDGKYNAIGPDGGALTMLMGSDAGAGPDGGDAGATDAGTTEVPVVWEFRNGLPVPYDSWTCDHPTMTCEMAYVCMQGPIMAGIVTSYTPGQRLAFSVTFPGMTGTIVNLNPTPN
jgi:hypothetical protein